MNRQMVKGLMAEGETLKVALEAVGMASSSYYYRPIGQRKPRSLDTALVRAINEVRRGHAGIYGYRKVTMALRAEGLTINTKKVLRHLRALGLTQPRKLKGRKWSRPAIVRPTVCNMYWEADFTYVWTGRANAYLCAVIDAWDRDIAGDVFSDRCRALEAGEALEKAVLSRFGGRVPYGHELTLRVDRGSQFTAHSFRETARTLNVRLEYAGIRCPEDKPYIESFFGSYKTEDLYRNEYNSLAEARTGWESYRDWYRYDRLHQSLRYLSPLKYATIERKSKLLVA
jgi:putative transposase